MYTVGFSVVQTGLPKAAIPACAVLPRYLRSNDQDQTNTNNRSDINTNTKLDVRQRSNRYKQVQRTVGPHADSWATQHDESHSERINGASFA